MREGMGSSRDLSQAVSGVSLATHTPGPWRYRRGPTDDWGWICTSDGGFIAQAKDPRVTGDALDAYRASGNDPWQANARLIAAAPTMFDELSYLADANDWFGQQRFAEDTDADFLLRVLGTVRKRARAAIAKALGREAASPAPGPSQATEASS